MRTDHFSCLDATTLLRWMRHDLPRGELFGIDRNLFFTPKANHAFRMRRYGQVLESPLGVAAGPHTQLAQNLIAAWLCGARYMELKTIQVLDELNVTKPCIDMRDEGYNCEWSQELKLDQSFNEYLKAFVLLHVLRDMLGLPPEAEPGAGPGFIFNMSAGYNLEGILSPTVQRFFDRMEHAADDVARLRQELAPLYPRITELPIADTLSRSLTVSTMHGCPPDEVEKIGLYFITERRYHTTIKLNPTLLGPERLRDILNTRLGFATQIPDEAFGHDLKYADGVAIIRNLRAAAHKSGVDFSLKLTNTLESSNQQQELPKSEGMVYMSGRALHPVSVNLAATLQREFDGELDISFSAGVDTFNVADVLACGLKPLTVCSDLLKPGGYARMRQYLDMLGMDKTPAPASSAEALQRLDAYAARVLQPDSRYRKAAFPFEGIKNTRPLPRFDCAQAPCVTACPASQDVPRYIDAVSRGADDEAWQIILATNPFPNVQGMVCDHKCQTKCTRLNYDRPLLIREIKRYVAQKFAGSGTGLKPAPACGFRAAVIGAGPSGLSCAHYLALAGLSVDVYEAKNVPGGMAAEAIPAFRLDKDSLDRDVNAILDLGVRLHTDSPIDEARFAALRAEHDLVYVAVGAQQSLPLGINGEDARGVIDQIAFLAALRRGQTPELGSQVVVVGGGNSAMDVARAAKRLVGQHGEVTLAYRRTRNEMPADHEEVCAALEEGVILEELCGPDSILTVNGRVTGLNVCCMCLEPDPNGGRPRPVPQSGVYRTLPADTLIVSVGQRVVAPFLPGGAVACDRATGATSLPGVFVGGDAARGASSLINAVADGRHAAEAMLALLGKSLTPAPVDTRLPNLAALRQRQARRFMGPGMREKTPDQRHNFDVYTETLSEKAVREEAHRCLQCDKVCNICVTVCPNRANLALLAPALRLPVQQVRRSGDGVRIETLAARQLNQPMQIVNLGDACNECGNCASFCPSAGAPYRDKPRVHLDPAAFAAAPEGFRLVAPDRLDARRAGKPSSLVLQPGDARRPARFLYEDEKLCAELDTQSLTATRASLKPGVDEVSLAPAVEMAVIYRLLSGRAPFDRG